MSAPFVIRYAFRLREGGERVFEVRLDPETLADLTPPPAQLPEWTQLEFHKCSNCPLASRTHPRCPTAVNLTEVVAAFAQTYSFQEAEVVVHIADRETRKQTSIQAGLSSFLGVRMATSGCPILGKLRPLVRFHLPFASELETIFRSVSMYLVGQYLKQQRGQEPDWSLGGLADIYREVGAVNRAFAGRLRAAAPTDANLNAIVLLDTFAKALPDSIDDRLSELQSLYSSWG